ncbi:MAG: hypothetical protein AB4352_20030 [Hormoscilla sp.]
MLSSRFGKEAIAPAKRSGRGTMMAATGTQGHHRYVKNYKQT